MSIGSVLSAGMQGVQAGIDRSDRAAGQVARLGTDIDSSDVTASLIDLKVSEIQVKASANVIKAGDELLGTLVDIKA
ncbi:MAG: hypothetical protein PHQ05_02990 [Sterolibacterium sp.]|nr:hypothetical protein [Sterolibacterium sp.]